MPVHQRVYLLVNKEYLPDDVAKTQAWQAVTYVVQAAPTSLFIAINFHTDLLT